MNADQRQLLRHLLTRQRVLSLAVLIDGAPYAGLLPFAVRPDLAALFVHASDLARHSRGLREPGAPWSAVIQVPDRPDLDPLQLPRLVLEGTVERLAKGGAEYSQGRTLYVAKFPSSARVFVLGDFNLYQLTVEKGRLIAGFGSAHTVSRRILAELAAGDPPADPAVQAG